MSPSRRFSWSRGGKSAARWGHRARPVLIGSTVDNIFGVALIEELIFHDGFLWKRFACSNRLDRIERCRAEQWIALDGAIELARNHCVEGIFDAINRDHDDIGTGFESSLFDGLNGAQGHVVVMRVSGLDIFSFGLQERLHDFFAFRAREIAALRFDDLEPRKKYPGRLRA